MPTYEYACPACGRHFDARAAIARRDDPQLCPHCGATGGQRVQTACAVRGAGREGGGGGCASCGGGRCASCKS